MEVKRTKEAGSDLERSREAVVVERKKAKKKQVRGK